MLEVVKYRCQACKKMVAPGSLKPKPPAKRNICRACWDAGKR